MNRNTTALDLLGLYLATREVEGKSPLYLRNIRAVVAPFLEGAPDDPREWRRDHLVLWLAQQHRGHKPSTVSGRQHVLWAFVGWLFEDGLLERDIRRGVRKVTVPVERHRAVDGDTFEHLLWIVRQRPTLRDGRPSNPQHYWRNQAMLHVLWSTGCRRAELAGLRFEDLDLKARTIMVRADVAKTRRARLMAFDAECARALQAYIARERGKDSGLLFLASSDAVRGLLRRLERQSGLRISSHDFRRGFAARARRAGLDVAHTARLLGHSTLTMAIRYSQDQAEEDAAIAAYRERVG